MSPERKPGSGAQRTVLVVDDEDQLLRLVERVLERAGCRTLCASEIDEARELFRAHQAEIDIVLLDVLMAPAAGAAELLPDLLAIDPSAHVILMSGDAPPADLMAQLGEVEAHFLRKPFAPKHLLRFIAESPAGPEPGSDEGSATVSPR